MVGLEREGGTAEQLQNLKELVSRQKACYKNNLEEELERCTSVRVSNKIWFYGSYTKCLSPAAIAFKFN